MTDTAFAFAGTIAIFAGAVLCIVAAFVDTFIDRIRDRREAKARAVAYLDTRRTRRAAESMRRDTRALRSEYAANVALSE